jgi:chromosome segregation ATPase
MQEKNPRPRGRPKKDPNAPTQSYHLSSLERARRATRRKIKRNKTAIQNAEDKLRKHKQNVKNIEVKAKKIENGLSGKDTRVIDMGDVEVFRFAC